MQKRSEGDAVGGVIPCQKIARWDAVRQNKNNLSYLSG